MIGCAPFELARVNRSVCIALAIAMYFMSLTGVTGIYFARCVILNYVPSWVNSLFDRGTQLAVAIARYDGSPVDLARQIEDADSSAVLEAFLGASTVRLERLRDGYCYGGGLRVLTWLPSFLAPYARLDDFIP